MEVKALVEHRHDGETRKVGQTYELSEEIAQRAIAEGWVEAVQAKKK